MILVTGATGNVGKPLVQHLLDQGQTVRVLARNPQKVAYLAGRVEVVLGDLDNRESLVRACQGVESVFLVDFETEQVSNTLAAALQTGVRRLVKVSTIEAGHEPMIGHGRHHRQREDMIRAAGLEWTFLRPTMYMSNALDWAATIREQGVIYFPGGEGRVPAVHPADVAAVAAVALTQPGHTGQAYALTGPEALSLDEMAAILTRELGRPVRYVDVPDAAAAEGLRTAGLPEYVIAGLVEAFSALRAGRFADCTDAVAQVTGRPPRTFEAWCRKNAAAFE
jgi:uncharacterized protein YbjT (DUF2867 family)